MTDNNNNSQSPIGKSSSIENIEKYNLSNRNEIVQKLRILTKSKSIITGYYNRGNEFFITAILDVLKNRNLLVLDLSRDDDVNERILKSARAVFKTQHQGITAQFSVDKLQRAKFQGKQSFACQIPQDLTWVQRREFFRVRVPLSETVTLQLKNKDQELFDFPVLDICGGGLSIADENMQLEAEAEDIFENCTLFLADDSHDTVSIVVRGQFRLNANDPGAGIRYGLQFLGIRSEFAAKLQRYINLIDSNQRRLEQD